ncbi:MAG TPA: bifunctional diguanylate cyclase/phosphodiesterase [Bosea sp. (in: a-proteobacteria)]|jgi:diguanylate cyclase (GGDEF)-like protein|nr:bifunctional diguanylate cyclase/phosphodiesterase [Bosea sp. (in: a-proteobacteria)]
MKTRASTTVLYDPELRSVMVRALYGTPLAIPIGMAIATIVIAACAAITGDATFALLSAIMGCVGAFRFGAQVLYRRKQFSISTVVFERLAYAGAWATALTMSCFGAYAVTVHSDDRIVTLAVAQTIGYIAGIAGRNSSRPFITNIQVTFAALPFAGALIASQIPAFVVIAGGLLMTVVLTISSSDVIHRVFVSNFRTTRDLHTIAKTDSITSLLNRRGFIEEVEERLSSGRRTYLLSVDVDDFKTVNDTLGHDVGDALLSLVAARISSVLEPSEKAARIGGDEFMIVSDRTGEDVAELAALVVSLFADPISVGKATLSVSVSIGLTNASGESIERSLKHCDLALYKAKAEGKNRWLSYVPELSEAYDRRIELEQDLAKAIVEGQFELHFQPIYSPRGRTILMCEALMRWRHPTRGSVSPAEFIPLAEQNGLIKSLGSFAIEQALKAAISWPQPVGVSVNVSAKQFHRDHDLVGVIEDALRRTGVAPHRVTVEVTETTLAEDKDFVIATLHRIRALGVKVALDDFGTGYSSLSYFAELPIDMLKIDRAFVGSIATSTKARALMRAITGLAGDLNVPMIVEGVETPEQFEAVTRFAPYGVQGFLFARPMPKEDIDPIIDRRVALPAIDRPSTTTAKKGRSSAA